MMQEARCLVKARAAGVGTPAVYFVDHATKRLYLEFVEGRTVKHFLFAHEPNAPGMWPRSAAVVMAVELMICAEAMEVAKKIGVALARVHNAGVVHGDLTTSNMIIKEDGTLVRHGMVTKDCLDAEH